jgi:hypothetical protein
MRVIVVSAVLAFALVGYSPVASSSDDDAAATT